MTEVLNSENVDQRDKIEVSSCSAKHAIVDWPGSLFQMTLEDDVIPVKGVHPPVTALNSMGYRLCGAEIVAYDFRTGVFLLGDGQRVEYVQAAAEELEHPPSLRGKQYPALGKYATCWLGDCVITSLNGRRAVVRTTCGRYAITPRLLRPLSSCCTVQGVRVLYGEDRCMVFPTLTCSGGAAALLEEIVAKMAAAGLRVRGEPMLMELQSIDGPAVALRTINVHTRMLLRLQATVEGQPRDIEGACYEASAPVAMAHVVMEDYLHGNPWALPISHELLRARLGIAFVVDTTLLFGPYMSADECLYLEAPQRALSCPDFEVDAEQLVLGVRAGRLEPQKDGTFAMPYAHGGWGKVVTRGPSLHELMWQLDDLYDLCLPLGTHKVDLPTCPACLLLERFGGEAYDPETQTVRSLL